jgi:hypothetical protein
VYVALYNRLRGFSRRKNGILYDAEKGVSCVVHPVRPGRLLAADLLHLWDVGQMGADKSMGLRLVFLHS